MSIESVSSWLATTQTSLVIQEISWVIPTVQTIHILGIAVVIGSILLLDLRMLGLVMPGQPTAAVAQRFLPWIWWTALVLLLSGSILIVGEPERSLPNLTFQIKMGLLLAVLMLTAVFQWGLRRDPQYWERTMLRLTSVRLIAVISLLLWIAIVFAGRWIAYSTY